MSFQIKVTAELSLSKTEAHNGPLLDSATRIPAQTLCARPASTIYCTEIFTRANSMNSPLNKCLKTHF